MKRRLISVLTGACVATLMGACLLTTPRPGTYLALIRTNAVASGWL